MIFPVEDSILLTDRSSNIKIPKITLLQLRNFSFYGDLMWSTENSIFPGDKLFLKSAGKKMKKKVNTFTVLKSYWLKIWFCQLTNLSKINQLIKKINLLPLWNFDNRWSDISNWTRFYQSTNCLKSSNNKKKAIFLPFWNFAYWRSDFANWKFDVVN